jgi:hypothetical protein
MKKAPKTEDWGQRRFECTFASIKQRRELEIKLARLGIRKVKWFRQRVQDFLEGTE